jgi:hypothetical protein
MFLLCFRGFIICLGFMVYNTTFNNISAISWQSALLVEETVPGENNQSVTSQWKSDEDAIIGVVCT